MKNNNEGRLNLEVLEDRIALNGAFRGAIDAGLPLFPAIPGFPVASAIVPTPQPILGTSITNLNSPPVNPVSTFQSQLQAFQSAQIAAIDQFFTDLQPILQSLNLKTFLII